MSAERPDIMGTDQPLCSDLYAAYPEWLKQRLEWFQDLKFGLFMHWGPYCQWGCIESWPLVEADTWARPESLPAWIERERDMARFRKDYWELNQTFNPRAFDPEPWAAAAERAGMRYVAFTTKHHDGFCMWDTHTTDYRVTHSSCPFHRNPRADIAKHVFETFRRRGFGISCYFSKSDWHSPYYWWPGAPALTRNPNYDTAVRPELWGQFVSFVHQQIHELMANYGRMDVLWLDGGQVRPPEQDIAMDRMVAMARRLQPGLLVADRTVGGPHENILTPEQQVPDTPLDHPWESCLTMGQGWAYCPDDHYKPARGLIHTLVDIVAKGGNMLLNIGPSPEGRFDATALQRLAEIGDWMEINGEAIHGTRPVAPYKEGHVCFTRKNDAVFAIILADAGAHTPPPELRLRVLQPRDGSPVRALGRTGDLRWRREGDVAVVALPADMFPGDHAWVVRFGI